MSAVASIRSSVASRSSAVEPALGDGPLEVGGDPVPAGLGAREVGLVEDHGLADRRVDLGDPVAHQPRARHEDPLDRHAPSLPDEARPREGMGRGGRTARYPACNSASRRSAAAYGSRRCAGDLREQPLPWQFAVPGPRAMRAAARPGSPRPGPRLGRAAPGRTRPRPRRAARCRSSAASSSGTPSPVAAVVIRTSGRFGRGRRRRRSARRRARRRHEHRPQLRGGPLRAGLVALVHDDEVGDLEQAGLDRLDLVAHLGRLQHDRRVRRGRHLDLALAGADGLDEDEVEARTRPARPRPHVDVDASPPAWPRDAIERMNTSRSLGVRLHPDPVAEERAAGDRRRGIDGDDGHGPAGLPRLARSAPRPASTCRRPAAR